MKPSHRQDSVINVVCLVMIDEEGFLFATQRGEHQSLGGKWEFPGGKVEEGEDPRSALKRELQEELQLDLGEGELHPMPAVEHAYDTTVICLEPFLFRCSGRPRIVMVEHQALRWCSLKDAIHLDWAPADVPILKSLKGML